MHVFPLFNPIQHPLSSDKNVFSCVCRERLNRFLPTTLNPKPIFFCLQIEVLVRNHLSNEVFTIHWHGMHQRDTPWMDGASMISQCPIGPGQSFLYRHVLFCLNIQSGTFFFGLNIQARFILS